MSWNELLFNSQVNENYQNEQIENHMILMETIRKGNVEQLLRLIENTGADINYFYLGSTPLFSSLDIDKFEIFELLIDLGADVNYEINGYSVVWQTIWQNKNDYLKILASKINKNTHEHKTGKSVLMEAVLHSNLEAVKALVLANFNINMRDKKGNTALHYALSKSTMNENDIEIVKFLIDNGADVLAENYNGHTPNDVMKDDINNSIPEPQQSQKQGQGYNNKPKQSFKKKNNFPMYRPK